MLLADLKRSLRYAWDDVTHRLGLAAGDGMPHHGKRRLIREYAARYGTEVFVETGTYFGDMLAAVRPAFRELHSIELSPELHARARRRFAGDHAVHLHEGDSGEELRRVLPRLDRRTLFWLDAHFSGGVTARAELDSPIMAELEAIFAHPVREHVVLVDDARCFNGTGGYPNLADLERFVREHRPDYRMSVAGDVIRLVPDHGA